MLEEHLHMLEEAKKRDHRKIGKELELFMFSEKVGQGLPLWLPRGAELRSRLEDFLKKAQTKSGYQPVITPHIGHKVFMKLAAIMKNMEQIHFNQFTLPKRMKNFC